MFELRKISKVVDQETHIHCLNLKLQSRKINSLLGATLSGKTTLMRLMAGLEKPTTGEIWFNNKNITNVAVQKRNVSMVYQQFINYPGLNVFENIASPLRVKKKKLFEIKKTVNQIAELLKLTPYLNRKINELSGGQQQRTALARALVKNADLILLDEPFANLDFKLREELRDELPKIFTNSNSIIVYATTEPIEALLLGGQTAILHEGKLIQEGEALSCYQNPINLKSAISFSDPPLNVQSVKKHNQKIVLDNAVSWDVSCEANQTLKDYSDKLIMAIKPHHLSLEKQNPFSVKIIGEVDICEITGSHSLIYFSQNKKKWICYSYKVYSYQPGDKIEIYINTNECMYFNKEGNRIN